MRSGGKPIRFVCFYSLGHTPAKNRRLPICTGQKERKTEAYFFSSDSFFAFWVIQNSAFESMLPWLAPIAVDAVDISQPVHSVLAQTVSDRHAEIGDQGHRRRQ